LLLDWQWVDLLTPVPALVSRPDARARCDRCDEEIINEREVIRGGTVLCRACAGHAYYRSAVYASTLRA
jgi:formylmethanofuran dehydrogenase subunit E